MTRRSLKCLLASGLAIATLAILAPAPALAEEVQVPVGQQGKHTGQALPKPGMTQSDVAQRYGEPPNWTDPVGEPPITSWIYPEFVVYFEYNRVLHTVRKHAAQTSDSSPMGNGG